MNHLRVTSLSLVLSAICALPLGCSVGGEASESIEAVSRQIGIEPFRLEQWRERALAALDAGLKERPEDDPLQAGLGAAYKRLGELGMENELLREKIARLEGGVPFHRARSRK